MKITMTEPRMPAIKSVSRICTRITMTASIVRIVMQCATAERCGALICMQGERGASAGKAGAEREGAAAERCGALVCMQGERGASAGREQSARGAAAERCGALI